MSLAKKDVRLKICEEAHTMLVSLAEFNEKDISEYGSLMLERALLGEGHAAKVQAERAARWGTRGHGGESGGIVGQARESQGKRNFRAVK